MAVSSAHRTSQTEEALEKARWNEAEHPRALDGRFIDAGFGGITYSGITHVQVPRGEPFAGKHVADVQEVHDDGTATVSLHVGGDHPAVQDAIADGAISSPDQFEAIARVDMKRVKANNDTVSIKRAAKQALDARAQRRQHEERERQRGINQAEYLSNRSSKLAELLPELAARDAARTRPKSAEEKLAEAEHLLANADDLLDDGDLHYWQQQLPKLKREAEKARRLRREAELLGRHSQSRFNP